jgi:signal transduction histidine kinase
MPVRTTNTKAALVYTKFMGGDLKKVLKGFSYDEKFLMGMWNNVSLEEELELFKRCSQELDDEYASFWMGVFSLYLGSLGAFEPIAKYLGSPQGIIKATANYAKYFNDEISYSAKLLSNTKAIITCDYREGIDPSKDILGCNFTKGIYTAIPSVWDSKLIEQFFLKTQTGIIDKRPNRITQLSGLIDVNEIQHATIQNPTCIYELSIPEIKLPRQVGRKVTGFFQYIFSGTKLLEEQDQKLMQRHNQLKVAYADLEEKVKDRTAELKQTQAKLLESEKRSIEHRITGGFAHEMRNALAGAQLEFKNALNYQGKGKSSSEVLKEVATILLKKISKIHEKYNIPKETIASDFIPELKTIAEISDTLSNIHSGVSRDIDRGLAITSQIRDYARMSEMKKGDTLVDIVPMLKDYKNQYKTEFIKLGINYSVSATDNAFVKADEIHLNSIFSNLILNAKDALSESQTDQPEIKIKVEVVQDQFNISIQDNGPGIKKGNLNEIFEPFFSTKPTTGTGLGLGIVKKLVELYSGKIKVESEIGVGTIFTVTLPEKIDG